MFAPAFKRLSLLALLAISAAAQSVIYEAEDGTLVGTTVGTSVTGFTGTGYVEGMDTDGDSLTFTVTSTSAGLYDLKLRYAAPYGAKYTRYSLNGGSGAEVSLPAIDTFTTADAGQVMLKAGTNTITFTPNWGWYLLDHLEVTPSPPRAPHKVTGALVNPNASLAAKNLQKFLLDNYGRKTLSGQQEVDMIRWIEANVGADLAPAVVGLDFMDYTPSRVERGTTSNATDQAIEYDARNGVVHFTWHWNAPSGLIDEPGKEWWRGFYTEATTFDLAATLANKTGEDYQLLIRDIDAIAVQLRRLEAANVPVLWRPLHEAEGGWFWWGAKGPEACKELWHIVFDRINNHHKINNLIWVWNSIKPEWYPGNDVVDQVSFDSYPAQGDHGPLSAQFNQLLALTGDTKITSVAEVGSIPDPDLVSAYGLRWSWWTLWNGEFLTGGAWQTLDFLKHVYNHPNVIKLKDMPAGWKTAGAPTTTTRTTLTTSTRTSTRTTSTSTTRTSTRTTSTSTTRTSTRTTSATPTPTQTQWLWGQCGGVGYTGPTVCPAGSRCKDIAPPYYSQCVPN